ncbi:MAG: nuclear transport factor 2 family protein [Xanthomonadales bacterium]|jgi:ketosteroid isomerase-like protein|nr:nuclear transport factor 2 family protein [Xanthomonadales bacterium]
MPKFLILVVLLFSAPLAADTEQDIRRALDYFAEVWNENDLVAMQGYYHGDFVLVNDTGVVTRDQHLQNMQTLVDDGGDRGELSYSNLTVTSLGDGHAVAYGQISLTFEDGSALNSWFTTVYKNTPFGWKALLTRN